MLESFVVYNDLLLEIEVLKDQIKFTERELEYWLGVKMQDRELNGIPLGAKGAHRYGANTAIYQAEKKIESLNKLKQRLEEAEQAKERMNNIMNRFTGIRYKIAYMRYVKGMKLSDIAKEINYSYDYVRELMSKMKQVI